VKSDICQNKAEIAKATKQVAQLDERLKAQTKDND